MVAIINTNAPLYGVLVSDKSHLMGERKVVKRAYTTMMAIKCLSGTKLPGEPKDLVGDALFELEMATIEHKWWDDLSPQENYDKFSYGNLKGPEEKFERNALSKTRDMGVTPTRVFVSTPNQKNSERFFTHLSATPNMPQMTPLPFVGLAATDDTNAVEVKHHGSLGITTTGVVQDTNHPHLHVSMSHYEPSQKPHPYFKGKDVEPPEPVQVAQLTVLDVDAAKENWDGALLKKYINELGLHVIPTTGKDALQPVLMFWSVLGDY
ncbi:hypothetical protein HII31_05122 [Pseudocercospora fuligena]|uniref:Uncharacterized protein n=1 Tax=Pseudocercospora fuligena TaxID=685502 RepID=A0A8H6RMA8_9PEZI|nr:hypothetical protein HII31_05122 [Pseudocercospora fuligena]